MTIVFDAGSCQADRSDGAPLLCSTQDRRSCFLDPSLLCREAAGLSSNDCVPQLASSISARHLMTIVFDAEQAAAQADRSDGAAAAGTAEHKRNAETAWSFRL